MIRGDTQQLATLLDAELIGAPSEFTGVAIDSRQVASGQLFVALPGERVDGHDFVAAAAQAGASTALVARPVDAALPQLRCADPVQTLGRLAADWRAKFKLPLIGVTGSNGKTTVKTMLAGILGNLGPVLATAGNYNNELGLPLTLCELSDEHRFAVIEMGAGQPGDIAYLAELARPTVGVVNNAGPAHLERMGSLRGVAQTKGEMIAALASDGVAVFNADDAFAPLWAELAGRRESLRFGLEAPVEVVARWTPAGQGSRVELTTPAGALTVAMPVPGVHNVYNALAATAAALAAGATLDAIKAGLEAFEPVGGRLVRREMAGGWLLIEDTYNANPASVSAGLHVLSHENGERWLVLGDMRELGVDADALHFQVGSEAHRLGVSRLFALGPHSRHAVAGFGTGGEHFADLEALVSTLGAEIHEGVTCLVKGSRGMRMERVSQALEAA
ncbi:MAG: UDP-N-acetylmuramoyl-tripeptide--D-alanyl-D-alanine ligase [Pseudomonadota bacterium]